MAVIDPRVISELRALQTVGSPTFLSELIDIFLREQAQHLARLRKAFEDRDAAVLERVAHTMKGSCGNLGAKDLSNICAELQGLARAVDWERAGAMVRQIESDSVAVEAELLAEKARR
jgi:HPt (histidine-containing phosphotransfer) domain-containing protein